MPANQSQIKAAPQRWFRFYAETLDDPKVQRLPAHLFKTWVNLLAMACTAGGLINRDDVAFRLRLSEHEAGTQIDELIGLGLLDFLQDGKIEPHNWKGRQFVTSSADRVAKYREKRRSAGLPVMADYSRYRAAIIERDGASCAYCESTSKSVVDHMVPIVAGGCDDIDNLCLACKECNSGKAGRTPDQSGIKLKSASALAAHKSYVSRTVTVTVTPPEQSRAETDTDKTPPNPPGGAISVAQIQSEPEPRQEPEPAKARRRHSYTHEFEAFWGAYPVVGNSSKAEAFRQWRGLTSVEHHLAQDGLRHLREHCRKNPTYTCLHACRYLSQRRWESYPSAAERLGMVAPMPARKSSPADLEAMVLADMEASPYAN